MTKRTKSPPDQASALKATPVFASEREEAAFWESPERDSTEYVDWSKAERVVLGDLKPTASISQPKSAG